MSITCPQARIWLHKTLNCWLQTSCRSASTTSAINRGLRATKEAEGEKVRKSPSRRAKDVVRYAVQHQVKPIRGNLVRGFVSGGERPSTPGEPTKDAGRIKDGGIRSKESGGRGTKPARRDMLTREGPRERILARRGQTSATYTIRKRRSESTLRRERESQTEGFESEPRENETNLLVKRDVRALSKIAAPTRVALGVDDEYQSATKELLYPPKAYAELKRLLSQLETQIELLKSSGLLQARHPEGSMERKTLTLMQNAIQSSVLDTINKRMLRGMWRRRHVRSALNDIEPKLHHMGSEKGGRKGKYIWFDYENDRLELVFGKESEGAAMPANKHKQDSDHSSEVSKAIDGNVNQQRSKKSATTSDSHADEYNEHDGEDEEDAPLSIPYTTAASTFLYGTNTVLASLRARRRTFYKLYLHPRFSNESRVNLVKGLAKTLSLPIQEHTSLKLLDRMSESRPHNGIVLETSRLPAPPVLSIGAPDPKTNSVPLKLSNQSREAAAVNGTPSRIASTSPLGGNPLIVLLDGITDPGNVGTILRTLHFYGVTAAAIATNTCASLDSAALAKASSGACEVLPILALLQPSAFVYEARKAGWKIFAAVAPGAAALSSVSSSPMTAGSRDNMKKDHWVTTSGLAELKPLTMGPCLLMLGAEGEGLRDNLKNRADYFVTIEGAPRQGEDEGSVVDVGVDSLNVSAAAGVLVEAFMRNARGVNGVSREERELSSAGNVREWKMVYKERQAKTKWTMGETGRRKFIN